MIKDELSHSLGHKRTVSEPVLWHKVLRFFLIKSGRAIISIEPLNAASAPDMIARMYVFAVVQAASIHFHRTSIFAPQTFPQFANESRNFRLTVVQSVSFLIGLASPWRVGYLLIE